MIKKKSKVTHSIRLTKDNSKYLRSLAQGYETSLSSVANKIIKLYREEPKNGHEKIYF